MTVLRLTGAVPPGLYVDRVLDSARRELALECDYVREAACGIRYAELTAGIPGVHCPAICSELCGPQVYRQHAHHHANAAQARSHTPTHTHTHTPPHTLRARNRTHTRRVCMIAIATLAHTLNHNLQFARRCSLLRWSQE